MYGHFERMQNKRTPKQISKVMVVFLFLILIKHAPLPRVILHAIGIQLD